jgi:hypothetical protein
VGSQTPLLGAQSLDYRGARYVLGRTVDAYAIWDAMEGGAPVHTFALTEVGWGQAWASYQELERPAAATQARSWLPSPTMTWRRGQPLALGPMRAGQLLDGAFRLYRMRFGTLLAVVALVLLPFQILSLSLTLATLRPVRYPGFGGAPGFTTQEAALWVAIGAVLVQLLFITPFLTASVVKVAADTYLGGEATVGSTYRAALPRVHSILWVTFLTGLAAALPMLPGAVLLILGAIDPAAEPAGAIGVVLLLLGMVPAVIVFLRLSFASAIVMVEGLRGTAALGRSWRLVRGLTWKVLGVTLLGGLIVFALLLVLGAIFGVVVVVWFSDSFPTGGPGPAYFATEEAMNAVVAILTTPFLTLISVLLYFDARIRKEGFDLVLLAEQIGTSSPTGA